MTSDYSNPTDVRDALVRALKDVDLTDFDFAMAENASQLTASFTSSKAKDIIMLDAADKRVLEYALVKDSKTNTQTITRTEIVKAAERVAILLTDIDTGNNLGEFLFPVPEQHPNSGAETFETLQECLDDFKCREVALQCEANRTCQDQFASIICCLQNGECYAVHLVFRPTSLRCLVSTQVSNFEAVAFRIS